MGYSRGRLVEPSWWQESGCGQPSWWPSSDRVSSSKVNRISPKSPAEDPAHSPLPGCQAQAGPGELLLRDKGSGDEAKAPK